MLAIYIGIAPRVYRQMIRGYADFSNFYTAGEILKEGQSEHLYDLRLQTDVQKRFSEGAALRDRALPYMRPPIEALLFLPFSYLSYQRAYVIWVGCNMFLVLLTAWFLRSRIPVLSTIPAWVYYLAYSSFYPIALGFALGQDAALISLLFAGVMVQWVRGKDFQAGVLLGLCLIKFQLVLPLIFILILKKQFRCLAGLSLSSAVMVAVSTLVVGWSGMISYPRYLFQLNGKGAGAGIYPSVMPSLRGLVQGWVDPMHPLPVLDVLTALIVLVFLVWAARQWNTEAPRPSSTYSHGMAVVLLAVLLAGYHEFIYDLSLLLPVALVGFLAGWQDSERNPVARWMLLLGAGSLLFPPLYFFLLVKAQLNLMAIPVLLLCGGFARLSNTPPKTWISVPA